MEFPMHMLPVALIVLGVLTIQVVNCVSLRSIAKSLKK